MSIPDNITIFIDHAPWRGYVTSSLTYESGDIDNEDEPTDDSFFSDSFDTKRDAISTFKSVGESAVKDGDAKSVTVLFDGNEIAYYAVKTAPKKKARRNAGARWIGGTRVRYNANAPSEIMYRGSGGDHLPPHGKLGSVVKMHVGGRTRITHMKGPGGGLVYVNWDDWGVMGVAPSALEKVK